MLTVKKPDGDLLLWVEAFFGGLVFLIVVSSIAALVLIFVRLVFQW